MGCTAGILSRCQSDFARGLRYRCRLRICRRRISHAADDVGRHHRQGQSGDLRLRYSAGAARFACFERLWALGCHDRRSTYRTGLLAGDESYDGRQFRFAGVERSRRVGRHQLRPDMAFDDERHCVRSVDLPEHRRRHPLCAVRHRASRRGRLSAR